MRTDSARILRSALSASIDQGTLSRFLASLSPGELSFLHYDFALWARDDQLPPEAAHGGGAWTTWLMLGGRGAGKTRAGAEWVRSIATASRDDRRGAARIALVGETLADARSVMVEGVSGLLAVHAPDARPLYEPSKRMVSWAERRGGATLLGRGPGFSARPAILRRLVRRARQMEEARRDLGHAAIRIEAWGRRRARWSRRRRGRRS